MYAVTYPDSNLFPSGRPFLIPEMLDAKEHWAAMAALSSGQCHAYNHLPFLGPPHLSFRGGEYQLRKRV